MRILYLYTELMGYSLSTIRELISHGCEVHVVSWDKGRLTPYNIPDIDGLHKHRRSEHTVTDLKRLSINLRPSITVVSGWQDRGYLEVCLAIRSMGKVVVTGMDQQWHGTARQQLARLLGILGFFQRFYSHAWVTGPSQYEYALQLGFCNREIIFDLYSADLGIFNAVYKTRKSISPLRFPHRFLYVGRFERIKGLEILLAAWSSLSGNSRDWELHLIGCGSLYSKLIKVPGIVVKDFIQPEGIGVEVNNAGCYILPSLDEPWGVTVHEMAAAGLPLVLSDAVGSSPMFLIHGFNGYRFKRDDPIQLAETLKKIMDHTDEDLLKMGEESHRLSKRITPLTSAKNLLSLTNLPSVQIID